METVRVYDPERRPPNWSEIIRPGQFVAFSTLLPSGASCDAAGTVVPAADLTCLIFDSLVEADASCRERVLHVPDLRFEIFDSAGRTMPPLITVVHPSRAETLEGNRRGARMRTWGAVALLVAAPILCWYDWAASDGLLILPTVLGLNFVVIAARLLQLNAAHATAEKERRERLAQVEHAARADDPIPSRDPASSSTAGGG